MSHAGKWAAVGTTVLILCGGFALADESATSTKTPDQIREEALAAAEAKRKAAEASGNVPHVVPFGADPENTQGGATPAPPTEGFPRPDYMPKNDPNATELERVEEAIRRRAIMGKGQEPRCYYGPVQKRIPLSKVREIALEYGETDAAWRAVQALDDDPNLPPIPVVVYSPKGPTCRPDVDKELIERREELLKQQGANK